MTNVRPCSRVGGERNGIQTWFLPRVWSKHREVRTLHTQKGRKQIRYLFESRQKLFSLEIAFRHHTGQTVLLSGNLFVYNSKQGQGIQKERASQLSFQPFVTFYSISKGRDWAPAPAVNISLAFVQARQIIQITLNRAWCWRASPLECHPEKGRQEWLEWVAPHWNCWRFWGWQPSKMRSRLQSSPPYSFAKAQHVEQRTLNMSFQSQVTFIS